MIFLQGIIIGLLGSFHCVGMCGPIAFIVPASGDGFQKYFSYFIYHLGRVFTYALFGGVLGLLGESIRFAEIQQYASIIIGAFILIIAVGLMFGKNFPVNSYLSKAMLPIKKRLGNLLKVGSKNKRNLFLIGFLNGFLPCGLVYVALSASLLTSSVLDSVVLMVAFGLGTIPALMLLVVFKTKLSKIINFKKLIPYALIFAGALLVVRGMNLGIPYVSPKVEKMEVNGVQQLGGCCSTDDKCER